MGRPLSRIEDCHRTLNRRAAGIEGDDEILESCAEPEIDGRDASQRERNDFDGVISGQPIGRTEPLDDRVGEAGAHTARAEIETSDGSTLEVDDLRVGHSEEVKLRARGLEQIESRRDGLCGLSGSGEGHT